MAKKKPEKITKLEKDIIYVWDVEDVYYASAIAKVKGKNEIFGAAWKNDKPNPKYNLIDNPEQNRKRAKRWAVMQVSNTLNALYLYGDKVLDNKGNVNWREVERQEHIKSITVQDFAIRYALKDFTVRELKYNQAKKLGLV